MSRLWKKVQDEIVDAKTFTKKALWLFWFLVKYKDSRHLLQNPIDPRNFMGFRNRAQRFIGSNYLDVGSPFYNITMHIRVYGKMLNQHFNVSVFTNPGDKVLKRLKTKDKCVPYFWQELGPCPLHWRTTYIVILVWDFFGDPDIWLENHQSNITSIVVL